MPQQFEFTPSFLLSAITARHYAVPQYQRSYSWTDQNLEDFWSDMERSIADGGEYLLGSFVLSREDSKDYFSIIDGQQRIATTTILLAVMRDIYRLNDRKPLGDMTLLRKSDNQRLGNGEWTEKRQTLSGSALKLNKDIESIDDWDKETIDLRQNMLAEQATLVWPHLV